jgi:hypothetical protein
MSITPPRAAGAYAVRFGLMFASAPGTPYLVEIDCRVTHGIVAIGILDKREEAFLYRVVLPASAKRSRVHLPIADAATIGRFAIQNWGWGTEAHIDINSIALLSNAAHEDPQIYHAHGFSLSRAPRELLSTVPFALDAQTLSLAPNCFVVDAARVAMSLTPPRMPWAFAVQFGLTFASAPHTPYLMVIDCCVTRGTVGVGILNKNEDDFIYRTAVSASPKRILVHLPIDDAAAVGRCVIQNWDSGAEAHVDVDNVALLSR